MKIRAVSAQIPKRIVSAIENGMGKKGMASAMISKRSVIPRGLKKLRNPGDDPKSFAIQWNDRMNSSARTGNVGRVNAKSGLVSEVLLMISPMI